MGAREFFASLESRADPARLHGIDQTYLFEIAGEGVWHVGIRDGKVTVTEGAAPADVTVRASGETFEKVTSGRQNPTLAYMTGKLKVDGDLAAAMKLQKIF